MLRSLGLKIVSPLRKFVFLLFGMHIVGPGELGIIKISEPSVAAVTGRS